MTIKLFEELNYEFATSVVNILNKLISAGHKDLDYLFEIIICHLNLVLECKKDWDEKLKGASEIDSITAFWHNTNPNHSLPAETLFSKLSAEREREKKQLEAEGNAGCAFFVFLCILAALAGFFIPMLLRN